MDLSTPTLEPNAEQMRRMVELALDRIIHTIDTLEQQPASDLQDVEQVARLVIEPLPESGQPYTDLLELVFDKLITKGYNTASPGTFSYVTGGGLFHSAVADLIAGAINRYVAYWGSCPGLAELEHTVVRWFADMLDLPRTASGVLLSGGSLANLSGIIAARRMKLGDSLDHGVIYASDQIHHSVEKALVLAGFPEQALRTVPTDRSFRLRAEAVAPLIAEDRRAGRRPFLLVANAGTTNTGAIDALPELAALARDQDLWLHVDAAYGGFFALTQRGKRALSGIEQADSIVLDPHKSLFLPFGTGCLLARDGDQLRRSHMLHAEYIQEAVEVGERTSATNFADMSAEMSRAARGLRIWLPMKLVGAQAFRRALDEKLDLADLASRQIAEIPGFEVVASPQLSILAFRATLPGAAAQHEDALNQAILERVNRRGRVHLSPTRLSGRYTLRISVLSFRSHEPHVRLCLEELKQALAAETSRVAR